MEFKVKQESGEIETYHIDRLTGISHKVNMLCSHGIGGFCLFPRATFRVKQANCINRSNKKW
jgi:hypothetical protein